jgi:hypothetical protein
MEFEELIESQLRSTRQRRSQLTARWGYKNPTKGLRRLDELEAGYFSATEAQLEGLAAALEVERNALDAAIAETRERQRRDEESSRLADYERWCERFTPHALGVPANERPRQIFVVAIVGPRRLLEVPFEKSAPEDEWPDLVAKALPDGVVGFGRLGGFVINYEPRRGALFDRSGNQVRALEHAYRPGVASFSVGKNRPLEDGEFLDLLSRSPMPPNQR